MWKWIPKVTSKTQSSNKKTKFEWRIKGSSSNLKKVFHTNKKLSLSEMRGELSKSKSGGDNSNV